MRKDIRVGIRAVQEPIAREVIEAARLRLKRQIAAAVIAAMADEGTSFEELDFRIGRKPGYSLRYINSLITGKTRDFDIVSDLCLAMGHEPTVDLRSIFPKEAVTLADANKTNTPEDKDDG